MQEVIYTSDGCRIMSFFSGISDRIREYVRDRREIAELRRQEAERQRREYEARIAEERRERDFLYALGNDFEDTVASMFDPSAFRLIHRTPRDDESHGRYVHGMELPDLRFREISTGRRFWVECKYRARFGDDWTIEWCSRNQLTAYKRTLHEYREPVLVVIGVGGTVGKPEKMYCLDAERLNFTTLFYGTFRNNRVYWALPRTLDGLIGLANRESGQTSVPYRRRRGSRHNRNLVEAVSILICTLISIRVQMSGAFTLPRTVFDFKEQALSNLRANSDADSRMKPHLKVQLVEVNTDALPGIEGFGEWRRLDGSNSWYICHDASDYYVVNKMNDRVWALYSSAKADWFVRTVDSWINGNLLLDNCWISSGSIQKQMRKMDWAERGIGLRYEDCTAPDKDRTSVSIRAWYGNDARIGDLFSDARKDFAISSLRLRSNSDDETRSEWYTDGRITINSSEDIDTVIYTIGEVADHYRDELEQATRWRDKEMGSFEFSFSREVDLERYESRVSKGTRDLKMWMVKTEDSDGIARFGGVDMHTWDRILLDMGRNFAYMTIPGKGCVNAAPRLATVQGETVTGRTRVFYNGDEVFV